MARDNGATDGERKRRGRGFASASAAAAGLVRSAGAARGIAERRLITGWRAIVGEELAAVCQPLEITYRGRGAKGAGEGLGATLVVCASGARAPEVSHLGPTLIERVNAVYGYRAVARVRVVQTGSAGSATAGGFAEPAASFAPAPPVADAPLDTDAADHISGVSDPELRAALARLERNVRHAARRRAQQSRSRP